MRISYKRWRQKRREPWRKVFYESYHLWRKEGGEALRRDLAWLTPDSVLFDIGGYQGEWTADFHRHYGAHAHIFEPHPRFASELAKRFADNPKITVHPFALGSTDGLLRLSDMGDASSAVSGADASVEGSAVNVNKFMKSFPLTRIDVAKINIEGGEYDLLPALIESGQIARFRTVQVQFHLYTEADIARREKIREGLGATHQPDWAYPFVWEQWSLQS